MDFEQYISYQTWRRKPYIIQHPDVTHKQRTKSARRNQKPEGLLFVPSLDKIYGDPNNQTRTKYNKPRPKSAPNKSFGYIPVSSRDTNYFTEHGREEEEHDVENSMPSHVVSCKFEPIDPHELEQWNTPRDTNSIQVERDILQRDNTKLKTSTSGNSLTSLSRPTSAHSSSSSRLLNTNLSCNSTRPQSAHLGSRSNSDVPTHSFSSGKGCGSNRAIQNRPASAAVYQLKKCFQPQIRPKTASHARTKKAVLSLQSKVGEIAQCPHCMERVPTHQLRSHCLSTCVCRIVTCKIKGCRARFEAREARDHQQYYCVWARRTHAMCERAESKGTSQANGTWTCNRCKKSDINSSLSSIEEHKLLYCSQRNVKCEVCGKVLEAWQMKFHLGKQAQTRELLRVAQQQDQTSVVVNNGKSTKKRSSTKGNMMNYEEQSQDDNTKQRQQIPLCKNVLIKRQAKALRKAAMKATEKCENPGCNQVVLRLFLRQHETKQCPKRLLPCPHRTSGCPVMVAAEDMAEHISMGCAVVQAREEKAIRGRKTIASRSFKCINDDCEEMFATHLEMQLHSTRDCQHRIRDCPRSNQGCKWSGKVKQVAEHVRQECKVKQRCDQLALQAKQKREGMKVGTRLSCPLQCKTTFPSTSHGLAMRTLHAEESCENRYVGCRFQDRGCTVKLKAFQRAEHEATECGIAKANRQMLERGLALKEPALCSLGCGYVLRNSTTHAQLMHQEYECPCRLVECSYCKVRVQQRDCSPPEKHSCLYFVKRQKAIVRARMRMIGNAGKLAGGGKR